MYRRLSIISNVIKNFDILATSLSLLHNYFDGLIKLFSDLAKFLDISAKLFFRHNNHFHFDNRFSGNS